MTSAKNLVQLLIIRGGTKLLFSGENIRRNHSHHPQITKIILLKKNQEKVLLIKKCYKRNAKHHSRSWDSLKFFGVIQEWTFQHIHKQNKTQKTAGKP